MILAAGLTPAWQQLLVFDALRLGEVNRASEVHWFASGKVFNVAVALRHLGARSLALALLGGSTGVKIDEDLSRLGVEHRSAWAKSPTRICTTLIERASGVVTELVENGAPVGDEEVAAFAREYEDLARRANVVVFSGSLPAGAPRTLYHDLMARTSCRVILDIRGPELLDALPLKPLVVKPNREELQRTLGRELATDGALRDAIEETHRLGAEWVVISQGKRALWVSGGGRLHRLRPPEVPTVNPIGCGDCMAAGIGWGLDQGMDVLDAVRLGMGAAAQNAATLLTSRLDPATVRGLAARVVEEP